MFEPDKFRLNDGPTADAIDAALVAIEAALECVDPYSPAWERFSHAQETFRRVMKHDGVGGGVALAALCDCIIFEKWRTP